MMSKTKLLPIEFRDQNPHSGRAMPNASNERSRASACFLQYFSLMDERLVTNKVFLQSKGGKNLIS